MVGKGDEIEEDHTRPDNITPLQHYNTTKLHYSSAADFFGGKIDPATY